MGSSALVAAAVAFLALAGCLDGLGTPSLDVVINRAPWKPGTVRADGTIAKIVQVEDANGRAVELVMASSVGGEARSWFQSNWLEIEPAVKGEAGKKYSVGDRHEVALHFEEFRFNGAPAVSAPELTMPFPGLFEALRTILDLTDWARGGGLRLVEHRSDGWYTFELRTSSGESAPASEMSFRLSAWNRSGPLSTSAEGHVRIPRGTDAPQPPPRLDSLSRWLDEGSRTFVAISALGRADPMDTILPRLPTGDLADTLSPLTRGDSPGGRLRYEDANNNSLLDDGDRLAARLDGAEGEYRTYLLQVGDCRRFCPVVSKFVYVGPEGPLVWSPSEAGLEQLAYAGLVPGAPLTTEWRVGPALRGDPSPAFMFGIKVRVDHVDPREVGLGATPRRSGQANVSYQDKNANGLFDEGDTLRIDGVANRTKVDLVLRHEENHWMTHRTWIVGYGPLPSEPQWTFRDPRAAQPAPSSSATARASLHPELSFGKTLTVSVQEGSERLVANASLRPGLVAQWGGGELWLHDVDASDTLSMGDELRVSGDRGREYEVDVAMFFGHHRQSIRLQT